jgi:peroxiredoxin
MPTILGETVGDFTFLQPDGAPRQLQAFRGKPLLLIFLRHLA